MTLDDEKLDVYQLDRITALLSRLGRTGYQVREDQAICGDERRDFDPDFDSDLGENATEPQPSVEGDA